MKHKNFLVAFGFVVALTLFTGLAYTMADFYNMPFRGMRDLCVIIAQFLTVEVAVFLLMWLLSSNKYVFAVVMPLFVLACSVAAYFRYTAHVSITAATFDLALTNDLRTSMDVITWPLILFVLLSEVVAVGCIYIRFKYVVFRRSWLQMIVSGLGLYLFVSIPGIGLPVTNRLPLVIYFSYAEYCDNHNIVEQNRSAFKGKAVCADDSIDVVFILGETLRAKNMQVNGYARPTTPYLMKDSNVVSLPNIYSEYGFTHVSVPYLLTRACPNNKQAAYKERSFIDIFKKAGYYTSWIANQESVETFIYFMNEADSLIYANNGKSPYVYERWLDGDVLPILDRQLANGHLASRRLTIIHTIGSHWWYNSHYPQSYARWKPELKSRVLSANTKEEFYNSYDNTVLYSDYFWHEVRKRYLHRNAIIIYLSDHAENLGENGIFGHGQEGKALHYPGCWIWMSDIYRTKHPDKWSALEKNRTKPYNSAFLFHTILDAGTISTPYIDPKYDLFWLKL